MLTTSTLYFAEKYQLDKKKSEVTQIEIIDPNEESIQQKIEKSRQLIKQLNTSVKKINDTSRLARFESEHYQRVEKESKATSLGITQNSAPKFKPQISDKSENLTEGCMSEGILDVKTDQIVGHRKFK